MRLASPPSSSGSLVNLLSDRSNCDSRRNCPISYMSRVKQTSPSTRSEEVKPIGTVTLIGKVLVYGCLFIKPLITNVAIFPPSITPQHISLKFGLSSLPLKIIFPRYWSWFAVPFQKKTKNKKKQKVQKTKVKTRPPISHYYV